MKLLYILYQYLIGFPLIVVVTLFTALLTIICFPWRNGKLPRTVQVFWSRSVLWLLLIPIKVTGRENVNPKQSYVFVANHQSFLDVFAVYGWLPNNFKWLMKKELRKIPFVGTACAVAGHIFVDRSNPRAAMESLHYIKAQLHDGISTVIFPEGTRSKDKTMKKFKETFAILSKELNIPIVPVAIAGSESACYSGSIIPKFCKKIDIEVLDPVMPTPDQSVESLRDKVASLIEKHLAK